MTQKMNGFHDEIVLTITGKEAIAKSHLAETLQDVLLMLGYQVSPDPDHGFLTPQSLRCRPGNTTEVLPAIRIVEEEVVQ
jgi:hypothetical protein